MTAAQQKAIHFHFADISFSFKQRTKAKNMIATLMNREGSTISEINYIFCSDNYLLELNLDYLKHNTLTDIITFHYHKKGEPVQSDIYISIERVKENAATFQVPFKQEFYRVLFHGALHLCGYKDKTKTDAALMRKKEDEYLSLLVSRETKKAETGTVSRETKKRKD